MAKIQENQGEFSSVLFDTLFGLVLFFNLDAILDITAPLHFILYLFTMFVLVHWWLLYKSADDTFGVEVDTSLADLLFGIIPVVLIEYMVLLSKSFSVVPVFAFLFALIALDAVWALLWRFVGEWQTKDSERIQRMERELDRTIRLDTSFVLLYGVFLFALSVLSTTPAVVIGILLYVAYAFFTLRLRIIDLRLF